MKTYTSTEPVFSESIPVVEEDDLVNAENNNASAIQLLQNILVLAAAKVDKEEGKSLVSDTERNLWNMIYQNATGYTDQKIADLIGGAPSTLDTLGEIAKAMADNSDVVEALNTAIGSKANQVEMESLLGTKLDKTGDTKDNTITFTSSDTTTPSAWTDVAVLKSGETHKSFAQKVATMFKNLRYLWKILGSTSLTGIGDGTVTGAINALNTGCATQTFPVNYTYGGSNGEANNGISTTEVAIFGRLFVRIKLPYDIKVAANNSVIFKLKMNSDDYLNKLLVPGYDVETCYMYDTNNELVPVTVTANAVANNASISFAARTYTITNSHNTELHSVQWRTIPVYFKLFQE